MTTIVNQWETAGTTMTFAGLNSLGAQSDVWSEYLDVSAADEVLMEWTVRPLSANPSISATLDVGVFFGIDTSIAPTSANATIVDVINYGQSNSATEWKGVPLKVKGNFLKLWAKNRGTALAASGNQVRVSKKTIAVV